MQNKRQVKYLPFGILGGWLIAVVIAILAAPLWAIMHLHPNGDDLTGRGGNGYMMVLSLLLRPALAIFGFIAAITISSVMPATNEVDYPAGTNRSEQHIKMETDLTPTEPAQQQLKPETDNSDL